MGESDVAVLEPTFLGAKSVASAPTFTFRGEILKSAVHVPPCKSSHDLFDLSCFVLLANRSQQCLRDAVLLPLTPDQTFLVLVGCL